jgi:Uma2 family endonuclease
MPYDHMVDIQDGLSAQAVSPQCGHHRTFLQSAGSDQQDGWVSDARNFPSKHAAARDITIVMNELFAPPPQRPTTQAADGLPRWCWTVAEIERLAAAGFFNEYDRFELLGGEIVPMMSPAGRRHETIRTALAHRMIRLAQEGVMVASVPQFNLSPDTYVKPDILVHSCAIHSYDLQGAEAWLAVEVAETPLSYDLKTKSSLYASHGVPEYWVINSATFMTTVHRQPAGNAYGVMEEVPPNARLVPSLAPELAVSLDELNLD